MRIRGIEIHNFLSFDTFEWHDLDPRLNVVVGPNGAGKTNLFHALRAVRDLLSPDPRPGRAPIEGSTHAGGRDRPIRFALDLELDTRWEAELMRAFLAAALSDEGGAGPQLHPGRVSRFLHDRLVELDISPLLRGRLTADYDPAGYWQVRYESTDPDFPWVWSLEGLEPGVIAGALSRAVEETGSVPGLSALMYSYGSEKVEHSDGRVTEMPSEGTGLLLAYMRGEPELPPMPNIRNLLHGRKVRLEVQGSGLHRMPTHREFARLAGLAEASWGGRSFTGHFVLGLLLARALVFTDNVRRAPRSVFTAQELRSPSLNLSNGEQLAVHLYQKKMGGPEDREQYEATQRLFKGLTRRRFEVVSPRSSVEGHAEQRLALELRVVGEPWGDTPIEYAGAGRGEALFLSSLIAGVEGKVALLDEPAQNLHPTVQTSLLRELARPAGNQFLVTTHSAHLVPPDALEQTSRFYTANGATARAYLDTGSLRPDAREALRKELRGATDARALLFVRGVILVEGDTEFGALPVWYEKLFGRRLDGEDLALYSVGSGTTFETYERLLEEFRVPWVIVCDGAAIGDPSIQGRRRCSIAEQLTRAGVATVAGLDSRPYQVRRRYLERLGVFTVAASAQQGDEGFEDAVPTIRNTIDEMYGSSKARKVRRLAEETPCPPEVEALLRKVDRCLRRRMKAYS